VQDEGLHQRGLDHALAGLPSSQRQALLLVGEEGLTYEEAAERTGEAIGMMKSRVSRGRAGVVAHFCCEPGPSAQPIRRDVGARIRSLCALETGRLGHDRLTHPSHAPWIVTSHDGLFA